MLTTYTMWKTEISMSLSSTPKCCNPIVCFRDGVTAHSKSQDVGWSAGGGGGGRCGGGSGAAARLWHQVWHAARQGGRRGCIRDKSRDEFLKLAPAAVLEYYQPTVQTF